MLLVDVKEQLNNMKLNKQGEILDRVYENSGNNCISGYLDGINNIDFDEFNHMYFDSYHIVRDLETISRGTVLDDESILIMQIQRNKEKSYYQMFGISSDSKKYTYLEFENDQAMEEAYFRMRKNNTNLCQGDLSDSLRRIGVDFDTIGQARVNVDLPNTKLEEMVKDNEENKEESSFIMY